MCGIAGILGRVDDANRAALKRMTDCLAHRGPDGDASWESTPGANGQGVLLGFRRLAIIDLSTAGDQPMVDDVTGQVLVYNGETYNFQALRDSLVASGQMFRSTGDSTVVLRSVATMGPSAVSSFRGMFAFALWDPAKRTLLLARDSLGIKPLYIARSQDKSGRWTLAFASEVRALLASGLLGTPRLEPSASASLVWNGFLVGPETAVQGVESLVPGQLRLYTDAGAETLREDFAHYPRADKSAKPLDEDELAFELEESVRLHLISDVPLGVFLSSGIDSSAVANLAHKATRGAVHTFTLAFEEQDYNEGRVARRIAQAIGTQHQEVVLTEGDFVGRLDEALDSLDQPTFDGLNSFYMSHAVRKAGFKVALVGTGGDELFGGYTSFRDLPLLHRFGRLLPQLPRTALAKAATLALRTLQRETGSLPPQTRWAKLPDMVKQGNDLLGLYQLAYALFLPEFQEQLLGEAAPRAHADGLPAETRARLEQELKGRTDLAAISALEQRLFLGERLLRDNDAASMAASIEQRLPLVDMVLLEHVVRFPDAKRFHPILRKEALRRTGLRGLDPSLFAREKRGFVLPFDTWIRQGLSSAIDNTLRDADAVSAAGLEPEAVLRLWKAFLAGAPGLYWSRVWAVYVLVRWCLRHGVRR
jgi:asparagine synthase (glutamine-hydrolysing)